MSDSDVDSSSLPPPPPPLPHASSSKANGSKVKGSPLEGKISLPIRRPSNASRIQPSNDASPVHLTRSQWGQSSEPSTPPISGSFDPIYGRRRKWKPWLVGSLTVVALIIAAVFGLYLAGQRQNFLKHYKEHHHLHNETTNESLLTIPQTEAEGETQKTDLQINEVSNKEGVTGNNLDTSGPASTENELSSVSPGESGIGLGVADLNEPASTGPVRKAGKLSSNMGGDLMEALMEGNHKTINQLKRQSPNDRFTPEGNELMTGGEELPGVNAHSSEEDEESSEEEKHSTPNPEILAQSPVGEQFSSEPEQPTEVPQQPTEVPQQPTEVPQQPTELPQQPTEVPQPEEVPQQQKVQDEVSPEPVKPFEESQVPIATEESTTAEVGNGPLGPQGQPIDVMARAPENEIDPSIGEVPGVTQGYPTQEVVPQTPEPAFISREGIPEYLTEAPGFRMSDVQTPREDFSEVPSDYTPGMPATGIEKSPDENDVFSFNEEAIEQQEYPAETTSPVEQEQPVGMNIASGPQEPEGVPIREEAAGDFREPAVISPEDLLEEEGEWPIGLRNPRQDVVESTSEGVNPGEIEDHTFSEAYKPNEEIVQQPLDFQDPNFQAFQEPPVQPMELPASYIPQEPTEQETPFGGFPEQQEYPAETIQEYPAPGSTPQQPYEAQEFPAGNIAEQAFQMEEQPSGDIAEPPVELYENPAENAFRQPYESNIEEAPVGVPIPLEYPEGTTQNVEPVPVAAGEESPFSPSNLASSQFSGQFYEPLITQEEALPANTADEELLPPSPESSFVYPRDGVTGYLMEDPLPNRPSSFGADYLNTHPSGFIEESAVPLQEEVYTDENSPPLILVERSQFPEEDYIQSPEFINLLPSQDVPQESVLTSPEEFDPSLQDGLEYSPVEGYDELTPAEPIDNVDTYSPEFDTFYSYPQETDEGTTQYPEGFDGPVVTEGYLPPEIVPVIDASNFPEGALPVDDSQEVAENAVTSGEANLEQPENEVMLENQEVGQEVPAVGAGNVGFKEGPSVFNEGTPVNKHELTRQVVPFGGKLNGQFAGSLDEDDELKKAGLRRSVGYRPILDNSGKEGPRLVSKFTIREGPPILLPHGGLPNHFPTKAPSSLVIPEGTIATPAVILESLPEALQQSFQHAGKQGAGENSFYQNNVIPFGNPLFQVAPDQLKNLLTQLSRTEFPYPNPNNKPHPPANIPVENPGYPPKPTQHQNMQAFNIPQQHQHPVNPPHGNSPNPSHQFPHSVNPYQALPEPSNQPHQHPTRLNFPHQQPTSVSSPHQFPHSGNPHQKLPEPMNSPLHVPNRVNSPHQYSHFVNTSHQHSLPANIPPPVIHSVNPSRQILSPVNPPNEPPVSPTQQLSLPANLPQKPLSPENSPQHPVNSYQQSHSPQPMSSSHINPHAVNSPHQHRNRFSSSYRVSEQVNHPHQRSDPFSSAQQYLQHVSFPRRLPDPLSFLHQNQHYLRSPQQPAHPVSLPEKLPGPINFPDNQVAPYNHGPHPAGPHYPSGSISHQNMRPFPPPTLESQQNLAAAKSHFLQNQLQHSVPNNHGPTNGVASPFYQWYYPSPNQPFNPPQNVPAQNHLKPQNYPVQYETQPFRYNPENLLQSPKPQTHNNIPEQKKPVTVLKAEHFDPNRIVGPIPHGVHNPVNIAQSPKPQTHNNIPEQKKPVTLLKAEHFDQNRVVGPNPYSAHSPISQAKQPVPKQWHNNPPWLEHINPPLPANIPKENFPLSLEKLKHPAPIVPDSVKTDPSTQPSVSYAPLVSKQKYVLNPNPSERKSEIFSPYAPERRFNSFQPEPSIKYPPLNALLHAPINEIPAPHAPEEPSIKYPPLNAFLHGEKSEANLAPQFPFKLFEPAPSQSVLPNPLTVESQPLAGLNNILNYYSHFSPTNLEMKPFALQDPNQHNLFSAHPQFLSLFRPNLENPPAPALAPALTDNVPRPDNAALLKPLPDPIRDELESLESEFEPDKPYFEPGNLVNYLLHQEPPAAFEKSANVLPLNALSQLLSKLPAKSVAPAPLVENSPAPYFWYGDPSHFYARNVPRGSPPPSNSHPINPAQYNQPTPPFSHPSALSNVLQNVPYPWIQPISTAFKAAEKPHPYAFYAA